MGTPTRELRLAELTRLRKDYVADPTPANVMAVARSLCKEIQNGELEHLIELRQFVTSHAAVAGLHGMLARALYSAIFFYTDDELESATYFRELRQLLISSSEDADVRDAFGMTISYLCQQDMSEPRRRELHGELRAVANRYPNDAGLQHWVRMLG